jgi:CDP-diacylglycerol--serine O-phosphatidyltransferase
VWIGIIALLMVSTIPTFSLKRIRIPSHHVIPTLLGVGLMAAFFTTAPWATLMVVGTVYIASIPLTVRASRRLRRDYQARQQQTGEPRTPAQTAPPGWTPRAEPIIPDTSAPPAEWRHERRTQEQQ